MPSSPLILVADDDDDIRLLVSMRLERAGYRVVAARNGNEALQLAAEHDPDLLVLDVSMPVLNGHDLCIALTAGNPSPPPVIFLSGRTMPRDRILGLEAGAVDYMTKPFDAKELVARVAVALRTGRRLATLAHDASVDRMAGLLNRTQLDDRLSSSVARAVRHGGSLGCVILDLTGSNRSTTASGTVPATTFCARSRPGSGGTYGWATPSSATAARSSSSSSRAAATREP